MGYYKRDYTPCIYKQNVKAEAGPCLIWTLKTICIFNWEKSSNQVTTVLRHNVFFSKIFTFIFSALLRECFALSWHNCSNCSSPLNSTRLFSNTQARSGASPKNCTWYWRKLFFCPEKSSRHIYTLCKCKQTYWRIRNTHFLGFYTVFKDCRFS